MKTELREFKLGSHKKAYVVLVNGIEVGTISQYAEGDAWVIYRGIGSFAQQAGTSKTKKKAIALLLPNPCKES